MPIRVVAVDDHFLVRAGIRSILDGEGAISLVGEGECGADIQRLVQEHRPDVILLDLNIPATVPGNGDGDEPDVFMVFPAIARLRRDFPETKVIILSQYNTPTFVDGALETGVSGYILKSDALTRNLATAIRMVHNGGLYFSREVARAVGQVKTKADERRQLTPRQLDVLRTLASEPELTQDALAERLGIATSTLKKHLGQIYRILGVSNSTAAIMRAVQLQILPPAFVAPVSDSPSAMIRGDADRKEATMN